MGILHNIGPFVTASRGALSRCAPAGLTHDCYDKTIATLPMLFDGPASGLRIDDNVD